MGPLLGAVLTLCTFGISFWIRRRRAQPTDQSFALKLVGISAGLGSISIGALYPPTYVLISKAGNGRTIATNLPPGVTEDALLGMALVGAATVTIGVVYGLIDHVRS